MKIGQTFNPFGHFVGLFIPNCIAQSNLKDAEKLLLGRLFQYAGKNGQAFPSRKNLALELHWKLRKLDHVISSLKKHKLIKTYQVDEQSPSKYIFLYHKVYEATVKNDNTPTVKFNSTPTVKNDKHKNKEKQRVKQQKNFTDVKLSSADDLEKSDKESCKVQTVESKIEEVLEHWFFMDGKIANDKSKQFELTNTIIFELFLDGSNPYLKVNDNEDLKFKCWTVEEIKLCIDHYCKVLKKDVSKMYFSDFVMHQVKRWNKSSRAIPDHSLLAEMFPLLHEKPSPEAEKLKKIFMNGSPVPETIFIRAANRIKVIAEKFKVTNGACESYRRSVQNVFIQYVKEKKNDKRFDIKFMCGEGFVDEFTKNMVKRNILIKKTKSKSVGVGAKVS